MARPDIRLAEPVRRELQLAMIPERDLLEAVRREELQPDPARPGLYHCRCRLPQPRPLDPETAEVRDIEVELVATESGWEISALRGLERPPEA